MPQTKEEKNAKERERYHKNKERFLAEQKEYRANNKEKEKARHKKYYEKNKETIILRIKEYRVNHKDMVSLIHKKYRANNPDKFRIKEWKRQGIIDGDFPLLEKVFEKETHCWICWESYNVTKRRKCLDHDWDIKDDDNVRYICCNTCNVNVVG